MDDYSVLVERISFTLPGVRGCLLLSDDGLVLGAYPDGGHSVAETAWLRFCVLGEPSRGFVAFADELWAYVRCGTYAGFVVAGSGVRPGVLVDQLEQVLRTADGAMKESSTFHLPEALAPDPLVPQVAPPQPLISVPTGSTSPVEASQTRDRSHAQEPWEEPVQPTPDEAAAQPAPGSPEPPSHLAREAPWKLPRAADETVEDDRAEDGDVDRVQLAQEFSGLLQMNRADDEASS